MRVEGEMLKPSPGRELVGWCFMAGVGCVMIDDIAVTYHYHRVAKCEEHADSGPCLTACSK